MNRLCKGAPLLFLWGSIGCRFDFEVLPPVEEDGSSIPDEESLAGATASSGGQDTESPPATDGGGGMSGDLGGAAPVNRTNSGGASSGGTSTGGVGPAPSSSGGLGGMGEMPPACTPVSGCTCAKREGKTYQFCSTAKKFAGAVLHCGIGGLGLLELETQVENDFIRSEATAGGLFDDSVMPYTSGSDLLGEGSWTWQSLTVFWSAGAAQAPYTNWQAPPTDDTSNNCLLFQPDGTWLEGSCDVDRPFVCESL